MLSTKKGHLAICCGNNSNNCTFWLKPSKPQTPKNLHWECPLHQCLGPPKPIASAPVGCRCPGQQQIQGKQMNSPFARCCEWTAVGAGGRRLEEGKLDGKKLFGKAHFAQHQHLGLWKCKKKNILGGQKAPNGHGQPTNGRPNGPTESRAVAPVRQTVRAVESPWPRRGRGPALGQQGWTTIWSRAAMLIVVVVVVGAPADSNNANRMANGHCIGHSLGPNRLGMFGMNSKQQKCQLPTIPCIGLRSAKARLFLWPKATLHTFPKFQQKTLSSSTLSSNHCPILSPTPMFSATISSTIARNSMRPIVSRSRWAKSTCAAAGNCFELDVDHQPLLALSIL